MPHNNKGRQGNHKGGYHLSQGMRIKHFKHIYIMHNNIYNIAALFSFHTAGGNFVDNLICLIPQISKNLICYIVENIDIQKTKYTSQYNYYHRNNKKSFYLIYSAGNSCAYHVRNQKGNCNGYYLINYIYDSAEEKFYAVILYIPA